jgi:hypothetical protein
MQFKPINVVEVRQATNKHNELVEFGSGGEEMAKYVLVGDNIVIWCQNSTNESF